jgi:hypothetical protein
LSADGILQLAQDRADPRFRARHEVIIVHVPRLPGEQDREASADTGGNERHDEYDGDKLGVHHYNCS